MPKTLLLLGGSRYILPVIEAAHEMNVRVVTCDYLPDNYAHKFSDDYAEASIIDEDAVLEVAKEVRADGVMSFAADPGVVSAAYVADRLRLPFQGSLEAVSILQSKDRFRSFLAENGFNCPESWSFKNVAEALRCADDLPYPVIVKPVDAAGSKGVSKVESPDALGEAVENALPFSIAGKCIVEQFVEKAGDSSDADGFAIDGKFECVSFTSQLFDEKAENPYTPAAYSMPASMDLGAQQELTSELQRLSNLLGLRDGVFNIETRIGTDGKPYIMEVAPRGGGNRLSEMLRLASGVDLVKASVQAALGIPIEGVRHPEYDGVWYQQMLHSAHSGTFFGIEYAEGFKERHVVEEQLWVSPGSPVQAFLAANNAFGSVFMRFDDEADFAEFRRNQDSLMRTVVR